MLWTKGGVMMGFVAVALMLMLPSGVRGTEIESLEIVEFGVYQSDLLREEKADATAAGTKGISGEFRLLEQTDRVPARRGVSFGLCYVLRGEPEGVSVPLTMKIGHPPIRHPGTGRVYETQEAAYTRRIGERSCNTYSFDEDWELVPGTWTIQLLDKERKMAWKSFLIYKP
jgi:hypothetical protein